MKDNKDVNLYRLEDPNDVSILQMIQTDSQFRDTFGAQENTVKRVANSVYSAIVRDKETPVGFVMIVYNGRTNKYEIDMGILKNYRKKGYATKAMELLKEVVLINELDVEVQTRKTNIGAIQSSIKNGVFKRHYFL